MHLVLWREVTYKPSLKLAVCPSERPLLPRSLGLLNPTVREVGLGKAELGRMQTFHSLPSLVCWPVPQPKRVPEFSWELAGRLRAEASGKLKKGKRPS